AQSWRQLERKPRGDDAAHRLGYEIDRFIEAPSDQADQIIHALDQRIVRWMAKPGQAEMLPGPISRQPRADRLPEIRRAARAGQEEHPGHRATRSLWPGTPAACGLATADSAPWHLPRGAPRGAHS